MFCGCGKPKEYGGCGCSAAWEELEDPKWCPRCQVWYEREDDCGGCERRAEWAWERKYG